MGKKKVGIIIALVVFVLAIGVGAFFLFTSGDKYRGFVYESGTTTPVANVALSDGRNVVKTGDDGSFALKGYRKTRFIILTVPSGYTAKTYYIPVSKDVESYNFDLTKEAVPTQEHNFLQVADTEIGEKGVGKWIEETKRLVAQTKPKFLIHTGDICYEAGLNQHIKDMNSENMGCDVRYIIGNHDYVKGKYGEELFESKYGPIWYSFEVGNVHYVVTPIQYGDVKSGYNKNDRWRWLANDLKNTAPDKKVVIFNHTNFPGDSDYVLNYGKESIDLKAHNLLAWIFGHYHYNFINETDGVLSISTPRPDCGGIDQSASATREIFIDKDSKMSTKSHYYNIDKATPAQPQGAQWSTSLAGRVLFCEPMTIGNKVFVGTVDDDFPRDCGVFAINADTGAQLWSFKTANSIKNNLGYSDGKIIAQDCEGWVYCLNEADGTLLWKKQVKLPAPTNTSIGICVADGVAYTGNGCRVTAIDVRTGNVKWETEEASGENSPARMVLSGDKLIVSSHWNRLYALNKNTGKQLWQMKDDGLRYRSTTPSVLEDGSLLVTAGETVFLIDSEKGSVIKKATFTGYNFDVTAQPLVDDGIAYIATATTGVAAFNVKSLEKLWDFQTKQSMVYTAPYTSDEVKTVEGSIRVKGDTVVFGASDGSLYTLNKKTGALVEEVVVGAPIFSAPSITGDSVIYADFAGRVSKMK